MLGLAGVEDVGGAVEAHSAVVAGLGRSAEQRGAMDRAVAAHDGAEHIVNLCDVALHELDANRSKSLGLIRVANEGLHRVTAVDQQLADVRAGMAGATGDEHCFHGVPPESFCRFVDNL